MNLIVLVIIILVIVGSYALGYDQGKAKKRFELFMKNGLSDKEKEEYEKDLAKGQPGNPLFPPPPSI